MSSAPGLEIEIEAREGENFTFFAAHQHIKRILACYPIQNADRAHQDAREFPDMERSVMMSTAAISSCFKLEKILSSLRRVPSVAPDPNDRIQMDAANAAIREFCDNTFNPEHPERLSRMVLSAARDALANSKES